MPPSMSSAVRPSVVARGARAALAGIAATVSALSIAICAAALELVWQGLLLTSRHISRVDLLSALLIGLVLAFLVDPLMERIRYLGSVAVTVGPTPQVRCNDYGHDSPFVGTRAADVAGRNIHSML
jgi:hypothetical protein